MSSYQVRLLRREVIARDTIAVTFTKPAGFTFKPGQAVDLTLIDPPETDGKGVRRAFSIVSAPFEDEIVLATRVRDTAFKRVLDKLPVKARAQLDGPFGSLTLHKDPSRPAVFIAGGIGITPFISMLRQALHDDAPRVIKLLYSNRQPEDAAFFRELEQLGQAYPGWFRLVPTMSEPGINGHAWKGRTGLIDSDLIRSVIVQPVRPVFYVVGPPAMVAAMRDTLARMGIDADDIRSEDFSGY
jgi:ferredoxin-NADP reductase